jgi:FKBP-type peptidyl-prolyl cis-trans isomerase
LDVRGVAPTVLACAIVLSACDAPVVNLTEPNVRMADETVGSGREARPGQIVTIDYRIMLADGTEVMNGNNFRFTLGGGGVIEGIDQAVTGMRPGGRRIVRCPPGRHWGSRGYGDAIPPHTTLTLDVRLVHVEG